jgi:hypothetical protein
MNDIADCVSIEASPAVPLDLQRCQFSFADGRRCRSPRGEAHPTLCVSHARSEAKAAQAANLADELAPLSGSFNTASDVNHVLGNLFSLLAQNRIPRRNAVALGYLAQLLLQTLPAVREELTQCLGDEAWDETLECVYCEDETEAEDETETGAKAQAEGQAEDQPEDQAEGQAKDGSEASINDGAPTQIEPVPLPALVVAAPAHTEAAHTETPPETPKQELPKPNQLSPKSCPNRNGNLNRRNSSLDSPRPITTGRNLSKMNTYAKCATKPCRMRTCKIIGLKVPCNEHLQKSGGEGGPIAPGEFAWPLGGRGFSSDIKPAFLLGLQALK